MSEADKECLARFPQVRRFLMIGFTRKPERDAPKYDLICLESSRQRMFIHPHTGYFRIAANFH